MSRSTHTYVSCLSFKNEPWQNIIHCIVWLFFAPSIHLHSHSFTHLLGSFFLLHFRFLRSFFSLYYQVSVYFVLFDCCCQFYIRNIPNASLSLRNGISSTSFNNKRSHVEVMRVWSCMDVFMIMHGHISKPNRMKAKVKRQNRRKEKR